MESFPLLERLGREVVILIRIPLEHFGGPIDAHAVAEGAHDGFRVVEEVISVDEEDLVRGFDVTVCVSVGSAISMSVGSAIDMAVDSFFLGAGNVRTNVTCGAAVVEETAELLVAGLIRAELVKPGHVLEWWDTAAVVRRDAVSGVADQEGVVELL